VRPVDSPANRFPARHLSPTPGASRTYGYDTLHTLHTLADWGTVGCYLARSAASLITGALCRLPALPAPGVAAPEPGASCP